MFKKTMKLFIKIVYFFPKLKLNLLNRDMIAINCHNGTIFKFEFSYSLIDFSIHSLTRIYDRRISSIEILLDELKNLI